MTHSKLGNISAGVLLAVGALLIAGWVFASNGAVSSNQSFQLSQHDLTGQQLQPAQNGLQQTVPGSSLQ